MKPVLLDVSLSKETWTLVGIVIGAVLGGLSQVVAGLLQQRHDHRKTVRANQQTVYAHWLRNLHEVFTETGRVEDWAKEVVHGPLHRSLWNRFGPARRRGPTAFTALVSQSGGLQAELRLVAPDDTYRQGLVARERATDLVAVLDPLAGDEPVDAEALREAFFESRDSFVRLAKRDLGIPFD